MNRDDSMFAEITRKIADHIIQQETNEAISKWLSDGSIIEVTRQQVVDNPDGIYTMNKATADGLTGKILKDASLPDGIIYQMVSPELIEKVHKVYHL